LLSIYDVLIIEFNQILGEWVKADGKNDGQQGDNGKMPGFVSDWYSTRKVQLGNPRT
jgi:hypothetical protein